MRVMVEVARSPGADRPHPQRPFQPNEVPDASEGLAAATAGPSPITARALSILAALSVDLGLVWLLWARAQQDPPFADAELFWVRILAGLGAYAVVQHWTLAHQKGSGGGLAAADRVVALSPLLVVIGLEAHAIGVGVWADLSWRHHAAALLWAAFAVMDFFATTVSNRRLEKQTGRQP